MIANKGKLKRTKKAAIANNSKPKITRKQKQTKANKYEKKIYKSALNCTRVNFLQ